MDLAAYLDDSIRALIGDLVRVSAAHPAELSFLLRFRSRAKRAEARRKARAADLHVPPFLIASIAKRCNLSCAGCYAKALHGERAGETEMSSDGWARVFREAAELGVCFILLAGGEPLLRQDVLDEAARCRDILFPVFTNGTMLDENRAAFFGRHRNLVPVLSVEGDREATDGRRSAGVHERIREAMARLKRRRIPYAVSVTVTKDTLLEATDPGFIRELAREGCILTFYIEYVPVDGDTRAIAPDDDDRRALEERIVAIRAASDMLVISFPGEEAVTEGCLAAGRGFVHINWQGGLEPCPFSPYSDASVADGPLADALRSDFLRAVREGGSLEGEHVGGCLLFEKREQVERLLAASLERTARTTSSG